MNIFAVEVFPGNVEIEYTDGSKEEIEAGIYERKNANRDTVEERVATSADLARLTDLAAAFEADNPPSSAAVISIETFGANIEIRYADGTKESVENGIYERKDADNETIIERPAISGDTGRLTGLADGGGVDVPLPDPSTIVKIEINGDNVEVTYADGSEEEIEAGIYERKNANRDTVEERVATSADLARLTDLAAAFEADNPPSSAAVISVEIFGANIEIRYADGTKESVENGIYERKNANNETIVERPATGADAARLADLVAGADPALVNFEYLLSDGTKVETGLNRIEVTYPDGSREEIEAGRYERKDTNNETVEERPATQQDIDRLSALLPEGATGPGGLPGTPPGVPTDPPPPPATIEGTENGERIKGSNDDDVIDALGGDDRLNGRNGDDTLNGGDGDDRARGGNGDDTVNGDAGNDLVRGDSGNDTVSGGDGNDIVRGDSGNDIVNGGEGDDRVKGGDGDDTVDGGVGSDRYWGGTGADTFVFAADGAHDRIQDFEDGVDLIDLSSYGFADAAEALSLAYEHRGNTYFDFGEGDVLRVNKTAMADIDAADLIV